MLRSSLEKHFSKCIHGDLNTTWSEYDSDVRGDLLKYRQHHPDFFKDADELQLLKCVHTEALEKFMRSQDGNHIPVTDIANCISLDAWTESKKKFVYFQTLREMMAQNAINHEVTTNFNRSFDVPSVYELMDIDNSQYSERVFSVRNFKTRDFINDVIDSTPRYEISLNLLTMILQQ